MTRILALETIEVNNDTIVRTFRVAKDTVLAFQDFDGFTAAVDDNHISVEVGTSEDASLWTHVLHDEMIVVGVNPDNYDI